MKLIDHYTKEEKDYRLLTLPEILNLSGHALAIGINGKEVYRVKINGKVRTWKRDPSRFEVPCKYGLYEYVTIDSLDRFVAESGRTPETTAHAKNVRNTL